MSEASRPLDRRTTYRVGERPDWIARLNAEGQVLDSKSVVPLDAASLIDAACRNEGLSDFGDGPWREHLEVLLRAIEEEANLHLLGRLYTRSDLLIYLQSRLRVVDWYKRHPEIDAEQIQEPVFVIGLGRSGTTILQEALAQDPQFRFVLKWEALFPCPPPHESTYRTDERIQRAHNLITLQDRIAPQWKSQHAVAGNLPVDCLEFTPACFASDLFLASFQIPSYETYLESLDVVEYYRWHRKLLKLLQWRYKRPHWLLKGSNHLPVIPQLLQVYPDAKIIFPARDPIVAVSSVVSVLGTIYSFRTDTPFSSNCYEKWMLMDRIAEMLNQLVTWVQNGTLRQGYFSTLQYLEFSKDPVEAIRRMYGDLHLELTPEAAQRMSAYLATKPKHVYGKHVYEVGSPEDVRRERDLLKPYQTFFGVESEV